MTDQDQQNTRGVPDEGAEADTASGGAPEEPDTSRDDPPAPDEGRADEGEADEGHGGAGS